MARSPIAARSPRCRARHPADSVCELTDGLLLPGFVDTHVHFPQARIIGALGMPLLEWLERCALPEEARLADVGYAREVAGEFAAGLVDAGTTTALVFGAHFAPGRRRAVRRPRPPVGLRVTSGLVVSDRLVRPDLHTTAQRAYDEGLALATRWHGTGRNRYAVIPRFALSCSDELLASCAALHAEVPGSWITSHLNENLAEIARCASCSAVATSTATTATAWSARSVFAHNVHPTDAELERLADRRRRGRSLPDQQRRPGQRTVPAVATWPTGCAWRSAATSAPALGSRCSRRGCRPTSCSSCSGADGVALTPAHLLYLATAAGAAALGLDDQVGDLGVGKLFDALWLRPPPG